MESNFSPRETVSELDKFIIGQKNAKRAVSVALRNRWRRKQLDQSLRDEIVPKNILMVGPTGCGKTEKARRLAKLAEAPFVKVEATKFTEVGYVGRDVEQIIRDLVEISINSTKEKMGKEVKAKAEKNAEEKILDILVSKTSSESTRDSFRQKLRSGDLNDNEVEIILNLTIPKAHYEVAKKALLNNKHVYSEKPMAINLKNGKELLRIAKKKKLYIGNAPDTFLGGGNQKSKELLEKKAIGKINLGNIIFAYPGVQSYHPNPEPWFAKKEGGPVIDMGPYYLTALVNLLGPAKQVWGSFMWNKKKRIIGIGPRKGSSIKVLCPTTYLGTIFFNSGFELIDSS